MLEIGISPAPDRCDGRTCTVLALDGEDWMGNCALVAEAVSLPP